MRRGEEVDLGSGETAQPALAPFPSALAEAIAERELEPELVYLAWEIGRLAPTLHPGEQAALQFIVVATLVALGQGSTRISLGRVELSGALGELGAGPDTIASALGLAEQAESGAERLAAVFGRPGDRKPLILARGHLYHQRLHEYERRLAARLVERLRALPPPGSSERLAVDEALADVVQRAPVFDGRRVALSREQENAARAAALSPLTVISGGPGTGKTSVILSILRICARLGVPPERMALAAPTGKAANRMEEAVRRGIEAVDARGPADERLLAECPEPSTLHRLLGYVPATDGFKHHEHNPLAAELLVVDEGSMIDLFLMERLLRSLRPGARLVLLGDAGQLPSVEAGAVFRDLMPEGSTRAVRLTQSYRMDPSDPAGRAILEVARQIESGSLEGLLGPRGAIARVRTAGGLRFSGVEILTPDPGRGGASPAARSAANASREAETAERHRFLERWYAERIASEGFEAEVERPKKATGGEVAESEQGRLVELFRRFESARLLCLTRGSARPTGAEAVNQVLHRLRLDARSRALGRREREVERPFLPGEPVMMLVNDYERGLFNGDQGLVLWVRDGSSVERPMAVFKRRSGFAAFHLDALRGQIRLAYAMTVHKAQGSEFDHVGVILPSRDALVLTREVLYTALTRSRRSVIFVGRPEQLERGIQRSMHRSSGIAERLLEAAPDRADALGSDIR
jgi:exodeoxyribonuclease V alpha subunit